MFKKTLLALALTSTAATAGVLTMPSGTGTASLAAGDYTCDNASGGAPGTICLAEEIMILGESTRSTPVPFDLSTNVANDYLGGDAEGGLINYDPEATVPVGARLTFTLSNGYFVDEDYNLTTTADSSVPVASLANVVEDDDGNITAIELTVGTALSAGTDYTLVNAGEATADPVDVAEDADTISFEFEPGLVSGDEVSISVTARDNLGNISSAAASSIALVKVIKQFSVADTAVNQTAVISVSEERKELSGAGTVTGDVNSPTNATLEIEDEGANVDLGITVANVSVSHVVTDTASFTGINHSETDTDDLTNAAISTLDGDDLVVDEDDATMAAADSADGTLTYSLVLELDNDTTQPERTVSVATTFDYTADDAAFATEVFDFGSTVSFSLDGANFEVPYIPFGDNTQVIFRLTNTSAQTGDLSIRYLEEGSQDSWKDIGVVGSVSPGITNVADMIMDAIKADSGLTKGKVALDVTINTPDGEITGYVAYKVVTESDRGFVGTFQ